MKTAFKRSFIKGLQAADRTLRVRVQRIIEEVEAAKSLRDVKNVKKMAGEGPYYRIGISIRAGIATFVRILHRKDIYRYFP